jgi:hypothetical protein
MWDKQDKSGPVGPNVLRLVAARVDAVGAVGAVARPGKGPSSRRFERSEPLLLRPPQPAAAGGGQPPSEPEAWVGGSIPPQVELVMSALEAGRHQGSSDEYHGPNRRTARRRTLRVRAALRLFSDTQPTPPWALYTRDVHSRGLGFITPHRLPLGYGGVLELPASCAGPAAEGEILSIPCTLLRCREAAPGWFEGSVYFNREQPQLAAD